MSVKKFRRKPVEVEVAEITKHSLLGVGLLCGGQAAESMVPWAGRGLQTVVNIFTPAGKLQANYGDYIAKENSGSIYVLPADYLAENYEEVQE